MNFISIKKKKRIGEQVSRTCNCPPPWTHIHAHSHGTDTHACLSNAGLPRQVEEVSAWLLLSVSGAYSLLSLAILLLSYDLLFLPTQAKSHSPLLKVCIQGTARIPPWWAIWDTVLRRLKKASVDHSQLHESEQARRLHIPPPPASPEGRCFLSGTQMDHVWRWTRQLLLPKCRHCRLSPAEIAHVSHSAKPGLCILGGYGLNDLWWRLLEAPQEKEKELQWGSWTQIRRVSHPNFWETYIKQTWEPIMWCRKPRRGGLQFTESKCLLWHCLQLTSVYFPLHC